MSIRALDNNNDWTFGHGQNNYLTGLAELKQDILTKIKCFKNDWYLDIDSHMDWHFLLGKKNNIELIKQELTKVINLVYGVISIVSIDVDLSNETRKAIIIIQLKTIYDNNTLVLNGEV